LKNLEVIEGFSDGESFLNYIAENELPDIVLLDLVMA
jgi:two-component system NarL family response regulator